MTVTVASYVFISYSSKDYRFVEWIRGKLQGAGIEYWIDRENLLVGTPNWDKTIRAAIKNSQAIVFIATPNAVDSLIVADEIAIAQMYNKTICPVWAAGEYWLECVPMGMGRAQYIDMRHDREDGLEHGFPKLLKALQGTLHIDLSSWSIGLEGEHRNPFKGLEAFTKDDARDFFGRATAVDELAALFKDRATRKQGRIIAVIGASGSGKSSLVMAGLIPRLEKQPEYAEWMFFPPVLPGSHPIRALTRTLSRAMPDRAFSALEDELRRPHGHGLANIGYTLDQRSVLLIDQFEELFMPGISPDERDQFISLIVQAADSNESGMTILLTLRADFYDRPTNYRELGSLITRNAYTVLPMCLAELREAVEYPTRQASVGLRFEPGLVAEIVFDLRASKERMALAGALPLLQFTLKQLYDRRDASTDIHTLTHAAYEAIGGVSGAISHHAEAVFESLAESAQRRLGFVFVRLIHVDERGEPTRARAPLDGFVSDPNALQLIEAFVKERLLLANHEGGAPTLEVAHEALLTNWERLAKWIEAAAEKKRLLQKLEVDARYWERHGKPRDQYRYIHEQEQEIESIRQEWGLTFSPLVQEFLEPEIRRLAQDVRDPIRKLRVEQAAVRLKNLGIGVDIMASIVGESDLIGDTSRSSDHLLENSQRFLGNSGKGPGHEWQLAIHNTHSVMLPIIPTMRVDDSPDEMRQPSDSLQVIQAQDLIHTTTDDFANLRDAIKTLAAKANSLGDELDESSDENLDDTGSASPEENG